MYKHIGTFWKRCTFALFFLYNFLFFRIYKTKGDRGVVNFFEGIIILPNTQIHNNPQPL